MIVARGAIIGSGPSARDAPARLKPQPQSPRGSSETIFTHARGTRDTYLPRLPLSRPLRHLTLPRRVDGDHIMKPAPSIISPGRGFITTSHQVSTPPASDVEGQTHRPGPPPDRRSIVNPRPTDETLFTPLRATGDVHSTHSTTGPSQTRPILPRADLLSHFFPVHTFF